MKKLFLCLSVALLAVLMSVGVFAAETVIYENDFSDPSTLSDFEQYCMSWEISDGALRLTEDKVVWSHIIYQADAPLTEYIVSVDYMNVQTAGGIVFNVQQDKVDSQQNGFYGHVAFLSNDASKGALGSTTDTGAWKGNINVGKSATNMSANIHIEVTVKGGKVHVKMNDIDSGAVVYDYTYAIGSNPAADQGFTSGTVGLRMRSNNTATLANSVGNAYFDNFKVTTANETSLGAAAAPVAPAKPTASIDTSSLTEVYRNSFDDASALGDFTQYRGSWTVHQGKLYLSAATETQSYILYEGKKDLTELGDYVIDVDMNNIQTQGGAIIRSNLSLVTGATDDGFMGYMGFISNDGTKGALGAGQADGKWLEGNIEVSPAVLKPGMNVHLQFAVKGDLIQLVITEQETGKELWRWAEKNNLWSKGSFGFRLRGKKTNAGLDNVNTTSFDNLVVSTFGAAKTEVKLQIGNNTGYVNGVAKTLDAAPIIRNSRTMLPVRFVAENLGASVGWDGATSTVTVSTATTKIEIVIGKATAKINGAEVTLDSPAFIENSRTYLPVRFVSENLGASVGWDGATSTVTLTK